MREFVHHGDLFPGILSPWRRLLILEIPCHVHWHLSYCLSRSHTAAICRMPCFWDPHASGDVSWCVLGPCLRAGCAHAAWEGGRRELGLSLGAWRRCLAQRVVGDSWSSCSGLDAAGGCAVVWACGSPSGEVSARGAESCMRERVCCLLVLNLVSSTLSCIRQPRPRLDDWGGAASSGSFLTVAQVAIWDLGLLLPESLVDYGNTPRP